MNRLVYISLFLIATLINIQALSDQGWLTSYEKAVEQAVEEEKPIILVFSGSDWCGNCIRLEQTLFESDEFNNYAKLALVKLNADFPMKKKNALPEDLKAQNDRLAEKYNPDGKFPRVVVIRSDGTVVGELSQPQESVEQYMTELKSIVSHF